MINHATPLAILLENAGLLTAVQIAKATIYAKEHACHFVTSIVKNKFLTSEAILDFCAEHFKLPTVDVSDDRINYLDNHFDLAMFDLYHSLPIERDQHSLQLAMADPTDESAIAAIRFHTGLSLHIVLIDEQQLERLLANFCRANQLDRQLKSALARIHPHTHSPHDHPDQATDDEPVIQFVNQLLEDAIKKNISDIHIENFSSSSRIRFRRDGLLHEIIRLPHHFSARMMTRLKIMAELDIAEKRLPQDGRFRFHSLKPFDFRVSTCPGLHGENMVLRLLQLSAQQLSLHELGMSSQQLMHFQQALQQPQGLIIVSGPTGSGKTATLYAALQTINQPDKNILTVEDPIEIDVDGMTQVNVNTRIGLDFAMILRAFLRQDPDIMMVGEIRDSETAAIAVQAAQTGHLVLATLHANSATDCIKRLLALGISACQLAGSLSLLAGQRLLRKRCVPCRDASTSYCEACCNGYDGRTGIFEVVTISSRVTQLLLANAALTDIEKQLLAEMPETLWSSGLRTVAAFITTQTELQRVIGGGYAIE